jgi:hypothetical protein
MALRRLLFVLEHPSHETGSERRTRLLKIIVGGFVILVIIVHLFCYPLNRITDILDVHAILAAAICVSLLMAGKTHFMTIRNNSVGLTPGDGWHTSRMPGLSLVSLRVSHSLGDALVVAEGGGTTYTIQFEDQKKKV